MFFCRELQCCWLPACWRLVWPSMMGPATGLRHHARARRHRPVPWNMHRFAACVARKAGPSATAARQEPTDTGSAMRVHAGPVETGPAGMVAPVPIGPGRGQNGPAARKEPAHVNTLPCVHPVADSCAPSRMPAKQGQQIGGSSVTAAAADLLRFERGGSKRSAPFF